MLIVLFNLSQLLITLVITLGVIGFIFLEILQPRLIAKELSRIKKHRFLNIAEPYFKLALLIFYLIPNPRFQYAMAILVSINLIAYLWLSYRSYKSDSR